MAEELTLDASPTLWSRPADERSAAPTLVMLHGFGADEHDLFGLAQYLPRHLSVASVAAPLRPQPPMPGRSWYPVEGLNDRDPAAITQAAEALLRWIDAELPEVPALALLGFSQGAAVALQALRRSPERFTAVVALSGYVAEGELPGDETLRASRPRVFWGRGSADPVIPQPLIEHTDVWLPDHADLTARVYPGLGHGISEDELRDIIDFVDRCLPGTAPQAK